MDKKLSKWKVLDREYIIQRPWLTAWDISKNPFARRNGSAERPCQIGQVNRFLVSQYRRQVVVPSGGCSLVARLVLTHLIDSSLRLLRSFRRHGLGEVGSRLCEFCRKMTFSLFRWNLLIIIEISLVAVWLHFRRKSGFSAVRLSITYVAEIAREAR